MEGHGRLSELRRDMTENRLAELLGRRHSAARAADAGCALLFFKTFAVSCKRTILWQTNEMKATSLKRFHKQQFYPFFDLGIFEEGR